jgi:transcriptional regulator with XRE-family HTH domain
VGNGDVATWLRETRLAAGLSQAKLAERTGVAARTIRHLESGQVSQPRAATERSWAYPRLLPVDQRTEPDAL